MSIQVHAITATWGPPLTPWMSITQARRGTVAMPSEVAASGASSHNDDEVMAIPPVLVSLCYYMLRSLPSNSSVHFDVEG